MPAKDILHDVVREALIKDGWIITHDPFPIAFGRRKVYADLGDREMDKLENYRKLVKQILSSEAELEPANIDVETLLIFDEKSDNYQLMYVGWNNSLRTHGAVIHVRLHNGKIWIEEDGTEEGVATSLLEAGIPKSDIVLAFHAPWKRPYTEFAVA